MDEVKIIELSNSKSSIKQKSSAGHCLDLLEPLQNSNTLHRNS
jgi:hypothetical protein